MLDHSATWKLPTAKYRACIHSCVLITELSGGIMMLPEEKKKWEAQRKKSLPVVLVQTFAGIGVLVTIFYGGYYYCDSIPIPQSNEFTAKLQFSLQWSFFPFALILFYAIMDVANKRGSTPASNPFAGKEHFLQLEKNILANTLEQTLLAFFIIMSLTVYLKQSQMKIIPLYILSYFIGRIFFFIGYKIRYNYRVFGIAQNFFSTLLMIGVIGYTIYSQGLFSATGKDKL